MPLDFGRWLYMLIVGFLLLDARVCCWLLVLDRLLLVVDSWWLVVRRLFVFLGVGGACLLLVVCAFLDCVCWVFVVECWMLDAGCVRWLLGLIG